MQLENKTANVAIKLSIQSGKDYYSSVYWDETSNLKSK